MIDNYIYRISLGRTLYLFQLDLDLDLASVSHACSGSGLCFLITLGGVGEVGMGRPDNIIN